MGERNHPAPHRDSQWCGVMCGCAKVVDPFRDGRVVVEENLDEPAGPGVGKVPLGELVQRRDEGLGFLDAPDDEQIRLLLEVSRPGRLKRSMSSRASRSSRPCPSINTSTLSSPGRRLTTDWTAAQGSSAAPVRPDSATRPSAAGAA